MLILGRRPGEYLVINDTIRIEVVKGKEGDLRLAFDAPKEIPILRGEKYEAIRQKDD